MPRDPHVFVQELPRPPGLLRQLGRALAATVVYLIMLAWANRLEIALVAAGLGGVAAIIWGSAR